MAQKHINVPEVGDVVLQKRRGNRSMRLSVSHDGQVRLTMPAWAPYVTGQAFVLSKTDWLKKQLSKHTFTVFENSDRVGKVHTISVNSKPSKKLSSRVTSAQIIISLPANKDITDQQVQDEIQKAGARALRLEAQKLLPQRLHQLSQQSGFSYKSVQIKKLRSRWGSCNHAKEISLSYYLMQLPWDLIDYVILHELVHTKVLAHGPRFWSELEKHVPNLKAKRKAMKEHRPLLKAIKSL